MDNGQRIGKWEVAGFIVGCVAIFLSGSSLYLWDHDNSKITIEIVPFALALNLIASLIWLCGISLKETKFLLVSLIWWSVPLTLWLLYLMLCMLLADLSAAFGFSGNNDNMSVFNTLALPITLFAVIFYIAAVVCFMELKKENDKFLSEIAQFGILSKESKQCDA